MEKISQSSKEKDNSFTKLREKIGEIGDQNLKDKLFVLLNELSTIPDFLGDDKVQRISENEVLIDGMQIQTEKNDNYPAVEIDIYGSKKLISFRFEERISKVDVLYDYLGSNNFSLDEINTIEKQGISNELSELIIRKSDKRVFITKESDGAYYLTPLAEAAFYAVALVHHTPDLKAIKHLCDEFHMNYLDFLKNNRDKIISMYWNRMDKDIKDRLTLEMNSLLKNK